MGTPTQVTGQQIIVLRVVVRAPDLDTFITRYSRHLDGDRIFIFTKTPQPPGTRVRFSLHLSNGEQLISGKGTVTRVQADTGDARHPSGMELVFVPLDDRSQTLVDFMLATRAGAVESTTSVPPIVGAVLAPVVQPKSAPPPLPPLPPIPPVNEVAPAEAAKAESAEAKVAEVKVAEAKVSEEVAAAAEEAVAAAKSAAANGVLGSRLLPPLPATGSFPILDGPLLGEAALPAPVSPGPAPAFAEGWREPASPDAPASTQSGEVPANPFSEVSDGAIEYFVEWSLEQSIGPRREPSASFSNIAMSLPGVETETPAHAAPARRRGWLLGGAGFLAGIPAGCLLFALIRPAAPLPERTRSAQVAAPKPSESASPAPAPAAPDKLTVAAAPDAPAPSERAATATLRIVTRPPGAAVTVDGKPAGESPLTVEVAAGRHQVEAAKERYRVAHAQAEAPGELALDLHRPLAVLHVTSLPSAAVVMVEGVARGHTPLALHLAGYQKYDVQVALPGTRPYHRAVYLKDRDTQVHAALQPLARADSNKWKR